MSGMKHMANERMSATAAEGSTVADRAVADNTIAGSTIMDNAMPCATADVFRHIIRMTGWSEYELAKHTGIDKSSIFRALRGQREISYGKLSAGLERAGFRFYIERDAFPATDAADTTGTDADNAVSALDVTDDNAMLRLIGYVQDSPCEERIASGETWAYLKSFINEIAVHPGRGDLCIPFSRVIRRVRNPHWQAFMAGLYRFMRWGDGTSRRWFITSVTSTDCHYRLDEPWSPLPKTVINHLLQRVPNTRVQYDHAQNDLTQYSRAYDRTQYAYDADPAVSEAAKDATNETDKSADSRTSNEPYNKPYNETTGRTPSAPANAPVNAPTSDPLFLETLPSLPRAYADDPLSKPLGAQIDVFDPSFARFNVLIPRADLPALPTHCPHSSA